MNEGVIIEGNSEKQSEEIIIGYVSSEIGGASTTSKTSEREKDQDASKSGVITIGYVNEGSNQKGDSGK